MSLTIIAQITAGPGLERLDTARERRLCHMPQLRGAAETARFGQADEVLEPFGFHG